MRFKTGNRSLQCWPLIHKSLYRVLWKHTPNLGAGHNYNLPTPSAQLLRVIGTRSEPPLMG